MFSPAQVQNRSPGAVTVPQYLVSLFSLEGMTALITGGTSGVGAGIAKALASAGADIILLQPSLKSGQDLKLQLEELGRQVSIFKCDLTNKEQVKTIIEEILNQGLSPDILINCGNLYMRRSVVEFSDGDWDDVVQVSLSAAFILSRDLAKYWKRHTTSHYHRKIINVSNTMSIWSGGRKPAYAASKGALAELTKTLSNEWAELGININGIAPGFIKTDASQALKFDDQISQDIVKRTPCGRWGTPQDLAGAVVYLASQASNFVTGETHIVDGGYTWAS